MDERAATIEGFLTVAGWQSAERRPLAGDLSSRRYERLMRADGTTAVLMDDDGAGSSVAEFVRIAEWLKSANLSAPRVFAQDLLRGLLLLEDLGDRKVSGFAAPEEREVVYGVILDLLVLIRAQRPPELGKPDAGTLVDMTRLADGHYPGIRSDRLVKFRKHLGRILSDLEGDAPCVSLRDFHADNLMWLPDRPGLARIGILDFQDAFLTHPVYDVVSLLTDARQDVAPALRDKMVDAYLARTGDDSERFRLAFAAFSLQRNLRILGVFARAAKEMGNRKHLTKLPRVYGYLISALDHPEFADFASDVRAAIPKPTPDLIGQLA